MRTGGRLEGSRLPRDLFNMAPARSSESDKLGLALTVMEMLEENWTNFRKIWRSAFFFLSPLLFLIDGDMNDCFGEMT